LFVLKIVDFALGVEKSFNCMAATDNLDVTGKGGGFAGATALRSGFDNS
jgi:hypothetical protein